MSLTQDDFKTLKQIANSQFNKIKLKAISLLFQKAGAEIMLERQDGTYLIFNDKKKTFIPNGKYLNQSKKTHASGIESMAITILDSHKLTQP